MEVKYDVMRGFLSQKKETRIKVVVITKNGYQMGGRITAWDETSIIVNVDGIDRLVMMSAVSTIITKE